jgi:hypothetical protein
MSSGVWALDAILERLRREPPDATLTEIILSGNLFAPVTAYSVKRRRAFADRKIVSAGAAALGAALKRNTTVTKLSLTCACHGKMRGLMK